MKEISLNILDIAQNSVRAGAAHIGITLTETENTLTVTVEDDGCGMTKDFLAQVTDPFTTTRTTRKVGLGLPLIKMEAEMTGGSFSVTSRSEKEYEDHGTTVTAVFRTDSIDCIPLGDIIGTVCTLIQGAPDRPDFVFRHIRGEQEIFLSTAEMRQMLGDVPLSAPEVIAWAREYLTEAYAEKQGADSQP